jgi:hypothetical protein
MSKKHNSSRGNSISNRNGNTNNSNSNSNSINDKWWNTMHEELNLITDKEKNDIKLKVIDKINRKKLPLYFKYIYCMNKGEMNDTIDYVADLYLLFQHDNNDKISKCIMIATYTKQFWNVIFTEMELPDYLHRVYRQLVRNRIQQFKRNNHESLDMNWRIPQDSIHAANSSSTSSNVNLDRVIYKLKQTTLCKFKPIENPIMSEDETKCPYQTLNLCQTLPFILKRRMKKRFLKLIAKLERKIKKELMIEIIESREKGHCGLSLGTTVASGNGYQPSFYLQLIPEIYNKRKLTAEKAAWIIKKNLKLRKRLQETIAYAINDAFANDPWYTEYKNLSNTYCYDEVPVYPTCSNPSESFPQLNRQSVQPNVPFTNIFFTTLTIPNKKEHLDKNAHGLCLMFCANKYDGGEINIKDPVTNEVIKIPTEPGLIIAGRWSRSNHWNCPVVGKTASDNINAQDKFLENKWIDCNKILKSFRQQEMYLAEKQQPERYSFVLYYDKDIFQPFRNNGGKTGWRANLSSVATEAQRIKKKREKQNQQKKLIEQVAKRLRVK